MKTFYSGRVAHKSHRKQSSTFLFAKKEKRIEELNYVIKMRILHQSQTFLI